MKALTNWNSLQKIKVRSKVMIALRPRDTSSVLYNSSNGVEPFQTNQDELYRQEKIDFKNKLNKELPLKEKDINKIKI